MALNTGLDQFVVELYGTSRGQEFGLSCQQFAGMLQEIAGKYLPSQAAPPEIHGFYANLRVQELVLARACAAGHEKAWEIFMGRYRQKLYEIAGYVTKDASAARELADSTYADLFGMTAREGERVSKLASYTGRGSLEGWLRTVIAQEHVNRYRRQRRLVSLEEETEDGVQFATAEPEPVSNVDPRVEAATDEALAGLAPEDRFILASYFLDDRTLAEIARSLDVHESTISRRVGKLTKSLRKQVLATLVKRGLSRRQATEAVEVDVRDLRLHVRDSLQDGASQAFPKKKVEAPASEGSD